MSFNQRTFRPRYVLFSFTLRESHRTVSEKKHIRNPSDPFSHPQECVSTVIHSVILRISVADHGSGPELSCLIIEFSAFDTACTPHPTCGAGCCNSARRVRLIFI